MSEEIHWKEPLETLVKKEAERCLALRWAHDEAQRWCATWNTRLQLISFILSTLTGAGAVGSDSILPFSGSSTLVGCVSLIVSTLTTVSNFLAFAKRSEAHRFASLSYGKLHANLSLQLSLPRSERQKANEIIDSIRVETERLNEIVPQIPLQIKELFHKKFQDTPTAIPTILNGLETVEIISFDEILRPKITIQTVPAKPTVRLKPTEKQTVSV
jgi:hypothetical protein